MAPLTCTLHCSSRQMPPGILLLGAGMQVWGGRRGHGFPLDTWAGAAATAGCPRGLHREDSVVLALARNEM